MKYVAIITSSLQIGGAERNAINLARNLKNPSYSIRLIAIFKQNDFIDELKGTYIPVYYLTSLRNTTPKVIKMFFLPVILWRITRYIMVNKINLVVAGHEYNTCYLTVLCGIVNNIPSILIVGNNVGEDLGKKNLLIGLLHKILITLTLHLSTSVISVSYGITHQLQHNYRVSKAKITTIYNGVIIPKVLKKPKKDIASSYIVISGRLVRRKGHIHLLKALWFLQNKYNLTIHLLILGDGDQLTILKESVEKLELTKQVTFITHPGSSYYYYVRRALLSVTCSHYEGFGNVIIESMELGTPVICSDCKFGPREILDDTSNYKKLIRNAKFTKYGILIPPLENTKQINTLSDSEIELALALKKLFNDKRILGHYKKVGKKRIKEFTLEKMLNGYDRVIGTILDSK